MPPKRKAKKPIETIEIDSDTSPEPASNAAGSSSGSRASPRKKARTIQTTREEEDDEDASLALARALQDEEDRMMEGQEGSGVGGAGPRASTSKVSPFKSTKGKGKKVSTALEPKTDLDDLADPRAKVAEAQELLLGIGMECGSCKAYRTERIVDEADLTKPLEEVLKIATDTCSSCQKKICRGCGEQIEADGKCCSSGRSSPPSTRPYLTERLRKYMVSAKLPKAKAKGGGRGRKAVGAGAGTGYGSGRTYDSYPTSYGSGSHVYDDDSEGDEDGEYDSEGEWMGPSLKLPKAPSAAAAPPAKPVEAANAAQIKKDEAEDKLFSSALKKLSILLPRPDHPEAGVYDWMPHENLMDVLALSSLPELMKDLLRNDSVGEWTRRSEVYFSLLDLLVALTESEAILPFMFEERREKKWSEGLKSWLEGTGDICWERKEVAEKPKPRGRKRKSDVIDITEDEKGELMMAVPLYSYLKRLITQADAFRKAATTGQFEETDAALISLCGDFTAAGERFSQTLEIWQSQQDRVGNKVSPPTPRDEDLPKTNGKGKGRAIEAPTYTSSEYEAACTSLAYDTVELGTANAGGEGKNFLTHKYNKELVATANSQRLHKNVIHLAKELAVLSTNLPPGIFLRVDEARIDCIKALITGPAETPYADGLFEFDIYIPMEYPHLPPQVWLKTTGNNTVRYNPNLYAEGKVCLSLIGTWPGSPSENWQSGSSTLLQVLVSIQSMILGTNFAYYNEPGYGAPKDDKNNKAYNANVALATVRWAMINWMEDAMKESIWSDVVAMHFTFKRQAITKQVATWAATDKRHKEWHSLLNSLAGTTQTGEAALHHRNIPQYDPVTGAYVGAKPAAPSAKPVSIDLTAKLEERFEAVGKWKDASWFAKIIS